MLSLLRSATAILALAAPTCLAMSMNGRSNHGLIGYGIQMYEPLCAHSCRRLLESSPLDCTEMDHSSMEMSDMHMSDTTPECYATDDAFLTSLAWCIKQKCPSTSVAQLETYWQKFEPGVDIGQPDPKWTYQESLLQIKTDPNVTLAAGEPLLETSVVSDEDYAAQWNALRNFQRVESIHSRYGIVLLVSGALIPIAASLLRFVPLPKKFVSAVYGTLIDPPLFGGRHKQPYLNLAIMPTRGQAIFIAYLVIINIVLCAVDLDTDQPNAWFPTARDETLAYITNRCGVLSFANIPLLILYAGRNNVLYYVTNWSQSTFLLLHRWVAYIATIQAVLHSIIYLRIYIESGSHDTTAKDPFWIWGIVATLAMCILLPSSIIPIRQKVYELFLAWHVALAVMTLVGCYLHIIDRFQHQWGYEVWIYTSIAVWGFDRVLRVLRTARNGLRLATITVIDDDYIRVNVPGVTSNGPAYLYFPTLTWKVWENHPFSATTCQILLPTSDSASQSGSNSSEAGAEKDSIAAKEPTAVVQAIRTHRADPEVGLSFVIRTHKGTTALLRQRTQIHVLIESDYQSHQDFSVYQTIICIVGGVGITAVLPLLQQNASRSRLYWSSRSAELVKNVEPILAGVDQTTLINERHNLKEILEAEATSGKGPMAVVISGPAGMADEVRVIVSRLARTARRPIRLVEESFIW